MESLNKHVNAAVHRQNKVLSSKPVYLLRLRSVAVETNFKHLRKDSQ